MKGFVVVAVDFAPVGDLHAEIGDDVALVGSVAGGGVVGRSDGITLLV